MKNLTPSETHTVIVGNQLNGRGNPGFAFRNPSTPIFYGWHDHPCHQITYAKRGVTQIEGPDGWHLLPTAHAIWIPAGTRHRTMIRNLDGASVYFDPTHFPMGHPTQILTFPVSAMLKEMLFYTLRWPAGAVAQHPVAQSFFHTLSLLCLEQINAKKGGVFMLPRATNPSLIRAMGAVLADSASASLTHALKQAGMA